MNLAKWKDIAEIVALLAVVASLIVVAVELRQTQEALEAQAYQARAFRAMDQNAFFIQNRQDIDLWFDVSEGRTPLESLSFQQRRVLWLYAESGRADHDNEYYQFQKGYLDEDFYNTITVPGILESAPMWRKLGLPDTRPEFQDEIDRILATEVRGTD